MFYKIEAKFDEVPNKKENQQRFHLLLKMDFFVVDQNLVCGQSFCFQKNKWKYRQRYKSGRKHIFGDYENHFLKLKKTSAPYACFPI